LIEGKSMFTNYLKVAVRNILRRKGYSFINIVGLGLGLSCCLLIFQFVAREFSFDRFNVNFSNLYRVTETTLRSGSTETLWGYALGPTLAQEVPEVVRFTRIHPDYDEPIISSKEDPNRAFEENRAFYVDPAFLQMFSYPLIEGNPTEALSESGTILVTQSTARKYFGSEDPVGKVLNYTGWISGEFRINGVLKDPPANSHLQFDFLLPMRDLLEKSQYKNPEQAWPWTNFMTYVQLRPDANIPEVEQKFTDVVMTHRKADFERTKSSVRLNAQPLRDVYLNDRIFAPRVLTGSYRTLYFFMLVGFMTLLIALMNYVNLATARSLDRAREVGIRKVVGAQHRQLILQFLFESALMNLTALLVAVVAADLLRPFVTTLAGVNLSQDLWASPGFWTAFLGMFCVGTLLAGLYPAFVLSSFRPVSVLKGKGGSTSHKRYLRRALVVLQFSVTVLLLAGTAIVYRQLDYVRHMDLGMNMDQILTVRGPSVLPNDSTNIRAMHALMQQLRGIPSIGEMATATALPGDGFNWYSSGLRRLTADPSTGVQGALARIDTGFAHLFGLKLVAGIGFDGMTAPTIETQPLTVIANETAVREVGFDSPSQSLNQLVTMGGTDCRIIGVFKDFKWSSAHVKQEAALFALTRAGDKLAMKVSTANLNQTIEKIKAIYTNLFPGNPFEYHFVDERFDEQYRNDERFGTLFGVFAAISILIACMGLFGLAAFTSEQRTKEIGVRKVLGATVPSLIGLLTREYVSLVLLANLIAWPLAYYVMSLWLREFAYRIELGFGSFLLAGGVALLIAALTVSYQAIKAATANPVESLRYE
jgi:putative ABC transport system permease protein